MKKIIISLSMIAAVAAIAVGGTTAFFSDTETSTGNTFTAGAIDLKVDSQCHYWQNGQEVDCKNAAGALFGTWRETDLGLAYKFFDFFDVKPGDKGENTISLHPVDNDAYICAYVTNLTNADNGINEPESYVDTTDGTGNGELQDNIHLMVWVDNGTDGKTYNACDNIYEAGEEVIVRDTVIDNNTGGWLLGKFVGGSTSCLGVAWEVPSTVGNIIQSDSVSADISFYAEQVRNNPNFVCPTLPPVEVPPLQTPQTDEAI